MTREYYFREYSVSLVVFATVCLTHLCDFLPSAPPGPDPQSWAWMMKVYSFCVSQSTRPRALSWPSPDVPFSTTASNGDSSPWMLNAQISPRDQAEGNTESFSRRGEANVRKNTWGEWWEWCGNTSVKQKQHLSFIERLLDFKCLSQMATSGNIMKKTTLSLKSIICFIFQNILGCRDFKRCRHQSRNTMRGSIFPTCTQSVILKAPEIRPV